MRTCWIFLAAMAAAVASADPAVKALLVVTSVAGEVSAPVVESLHAPFASALSGENFEIVHARDLLGAAQGAVEANASPMRLAELCGAEVLLTASLDSCARRTFGAPPIAGQLAVTWTLTAKRVPDGTLLCSATAPYSGRKHAWSVWDANGAFLREEGLRASVRPAAAAFLAAAKGRVSASARPNPVTLAVVANVAGADVKVDGVTVGLAGPRLQAPLAVPVTPGLHTLEVAYPWMAPYRTTLRITEATTFVINLQESQEGQAMRQKDELLRAAVKRLLEGGATDDDAKLLRARGCAKSLKANSFSFSGMPERLSVVSVESDGVDVVILRLKDE